MTNQFQHKLVSNIRQFILAGKPARIGHLGVFCLVHKEPEEKMREDGSLILTPPANVIEFMPDPHLRIVDENPLIKNLSDDLYYDKELLKEAIKGFARDISNGAEECSVMVQGLGSFKKVDGVLSFKPATDFAKEANKVYDGLKEIELMSSGNTQQGRDSGSERSDLISVIKDEKLDEPANEDFKQYFLNREDEPEASIDDTEEIDVFSKDSNTFDDAKPSDDIFEDDEVTLNYEFGSALGFDDGLESFGRKKPESKTIRPENDEDEKIDIFGESSFDFDVPNKKDENLFESKPETEKPETEKVHKSDAYSELDKEIESDDEINIFDPLPEADFEQNEKDVSIDDGGLTPLEDFKKSQAGDDDFFFADFEKDNESRHEAFEEDLDSFSLKISLSDDEEKLNEKKKAKEEAERKAQKEQEEAKKRKEREEQKRLEAERKAREEAERKAREEAESFDRDIDSGSPGAFRLRRKSGNLNADTSHFEDDIITPVRPSSDSGFNDKGLGVAISIAAIILFAIMIYLVYTLFPAEEPDFRPMATATTTQSQRLIEDPFADGSNNQLQAGMRSAQQQQQQAQNLIPPTESGALTYDDILLELTRQNRGGLFGLYGEFNENISPFFGIVLFATNFRQEADDFARSLREDNDWRTTVIPHQRSDGSRGWRVMVGQFSTISDANIEARLLPARYREEFLIQRYERPEE